MTTPLLDRLSNLVPPGNVEAVSTGVGGVPLAAPADTEQAAELLRFASAEGLRVLPVGFGSKAGDLAAGSDADFLLSSKNHAGVVNYEPGDGTLTARSGSSMGSLRRVVAEGGHRLSPDVPRPEGASLGGVLAAAESGFDRLRFGPVRHNVLGMHVLLADGSRTKSGGRLVKNVTGYDLHRLYCGSKGSLCWIVEASLRLYPKPACVHVGRETFDDRNEALRNARELAALPIHPTSLCLHDRDDDNWTLLLQLEGREEVVKAEREHAQRTSPELEWIEGDEANRTAERTRDLETSPGPPDLRIECLPNRLPEVLDAVERVAAHLDAPVSASAHPAIATAALWFAATTTGRELLRFADELNVECRPLHVRPRAGAGRAATLPIGAVALMERLKSTLDPGRTFAPGVPGLS